MIGTDEGTGTGTGTLTRGKLAARRLKILAACFTRLLAIVDKALRRAPRRSRAEPVDGHSLRKHIREGPAPFRRPPPLSPASTLKTLRRAWCPWGRNPALGRLGNDAAEGLQGDGRDDGEGGEGGASRRRGRGGRPGREKLFSWGPSWRREHRHQRGGESLGAEMDGRPMARFLVLAFWPWTRSSWPRGRRRGRRRRRRRRPSCRHRR